MTKDLRRRKRDYAAGQGAITVGDLRRQLEVFGDDWTVIFSDTEAGNPMVFNRTKSRGAKLVQIELNELTDEWFEGVVEG